MGLLGALTLALLIKLSLWLSGRSPLNEGIAPISPYMAISSGGIASFFEGRAGLERVDIRGSALGDSLRVAHAELRFNGLGELLLFIALEQPLLEACGRYLKDPSALRLELEPGEGLVWGGLRFFEAKDVLARLHSVWRINQQLVEPLGLAWRDPPAHKTPLADELVVEVAEPTLGMPHHELVNLAGLLEYAGKRLQFITYDGAYYSGRVT